jgi:general secretion pathway protein M
MRRGDASPWAWAFWLLVLAGLVAWAVARVWSVHEAAREQLETIEPRHARLVGLGTERVRLEEALRQASEALGRHVYPASRDVSQAGNDAQQRVRETFTKAGLEVVSIQLLPAKSGAQFDRIPVSLRLEGEMTALQAGLAVLPSTLPTLFVEGLNLQSGSGLQPAGPVRVVAQFELFVLRARR